ncbi:MAG: sigma-70 family RNA polymerase sigma factor [Ilumatobacteraceae bacterium]
MALAEFLAMIQPVVERACARWRVVDSDDLVQEVALRLTSALRRGGGPTSNVMGYVSVVVRNVALDAVSGPVCLPLPADASIAARAELETVHAAELLAGLQERERALAWGRWVDDVPIAKLAADRGLSEAATRKQLQRLRMKLAQSLRKKGVQESD